MSYELNKKKQLIHDVKKLDVKNAVNLPQNIRAMIEHTLFDEARNNIECMNEALESIRQWDEDNLLKLPVNFRREILSALSDEAHS